MNRRVCDFEYSDSKQESISMHNNIWWRQVFALMIVESSFNYSEVQGEINLNQRRM
jgi:hypothetical protein